MIDALNFATATEPRTAKSSASDKDEPPQFSFALAAAALADRAGASLKAFGGAPTGGPTEIGRSAGFGRADNSSTTSRTSAPAPANPSPANADPVADKPPAAAPSLPTVTEARGAATLSASPAAAAISAVVAAVSPALTASLTAPPPEGVARDVAVRNATNAAQTKRLAAPRAPSAPEQDFARLLSRRLESGASSFDIRLDPPELGRVEGRLTVSDDGKATLALKFDNQAAFDLFVRDADALKAALTGAGFDLGAGDFALSFERRAAGETAERQSGAAVATPHALAVEPQFLSPYSQGLIDLRA